MSEDTQEAVPTITLKVTDYIASRQIEKVGGELITGDTKYELVLQLPNGRKHLVRVHRDFFDDYMQAVQEVVDHPS